MHTQTHMEMSNLLDVTSKFDWLEMDGHTAHAHTTKYILWLKKQLKNKQQKLNQAAVKISYDVKDLKEIKLKN